MARTKNEKFESCVRQVKGQKGYNPYAVCNASVKGRKKSKSKRKK